MRGLRFVLPVAVCLASRWVKARETSILANGLPLTTGQIDDARQAGVVRPENIRIQIADSVPLPGNALLRQIIRRSGVPAMEAAAMSLRYGICVARCHQGNRELLIHELVHTAQYERLGSIEAFLEIYLRQCLEQGYSNAPMEHEAGETARRIVLESPC